MNIILRCALLSAFAAAVFFGTARADVFFDTLDDVPVMPGLAEDVDAGLVFEAAAGRIVTARATGARRPGLDAGAVLSFYGATLPALGWRAETPSRFRRDGEVLTLAVEQDSARIGLSLDLRPAASPPHPGSRP